MSAVDARAKKILFDRHWTSKGWIDDCARRTSPEDRAYALAQGVMFPPYSADHDALLASLRALVAATDPEAAAGAFLASLSARRLDQRSALASLVVARGIAPHPLRASPAGASLCADCGAYARYQDEDLDVLNFERHKWGGVRHTDPLYLMLDLRELPRCLPAAPTPDDLAIFARVLERVARSAPRDTPAKLSKNLAELLPSSKPERDALVELLAAMGVLVASDPGRDCGDFACAGAWRGADGYDPEAVRRLFGPWIARLG